MRLPLKPCSRRAKELQPGLHLSRDVQLPRTTIMTGGSDSRSSFTQLSSAFYQTVVAT
jgi:hypothetical protein